jgi:hypothetical protein
MGKSLRIEAASKVRVPELASMNTGAMAALGAAAADAVGATATLGSAGSGESAPLADRAGDRSRVSAGSVGETLNAAAVHPRCGSLRSIGAANGERSYACCAAWGESTPPRLWRGSTRSAGRNGSVLRGVAAVGIARGPAGGAGGRGASPGIIWRASVGERPERSPAPTEGAVTSGWLKTRKALSAALRSTGAENGESAKAAGSSEPSGDREESGSISPRSGTFPSTACRGSTRGAAIAVWLTAGATARDWTKAKGEAEPAEAPNEGWGTEDGTPSVGTSGGATGGCAGMTLAVRGAGQGVGGDTGTAGELIGAPPVKP